VTTTASPYELYYWPSIQGRGEFVRVVLEEAGAPYIDVARLSDKEGGGVKLMLKVMRDAAGDLEPFAPPFLRAGKLLVAQVANILAFLGARHGLVPADEASRLRANQLQLTIADVVAEVHDTHHPISTALYYEDQKPEAVRRAASFVNDRIPKYLGYFERVLERGDGAYLVGDALSYVDLSMFQLLTGLLHSFPRAMGRVGPTIPKLLAQRASIAARPRIAAYLASPRRVRFNQDGLFRRYPELDAEPADKS
jgi:glutathione S-transferase